MSVSAYAVPWDRDQGLASVRAHAGQLDQISPVWYTPQDDGTLVRNMATDTDSFVSIVRDAEATLVPSVSNFRDGGWDGELVAGILEDEDLTESHVSAIVSTVLQQGWDGIDIDYESLPADTRTSYASFLALLGDRLRANDKVLSVTVQAKASQEGAAPFHRAQDYREIGLAADTVRIMAYDHHWAGSQHGPLAPLDWVQSVLDFAVTKVEPAKVSLGIAAYGYDWGASGGEVISSSEALTLAQRVGAEVRWDEQSRSPWFAYADSQGVQHTVWFENGRSAAAKLRLAEAFDIGGVFLWRLGGEDADVWRHLDEIQDS